MSNSFHVSSHKRLATSPIASNPPCTKKILTSSAKKSPSRIPKAFTIKRASSTPAISQTITPKKIFVVGQKSEKPIVEKKFPCFNCKCCESIKQMQSVLLEVYQRQKNLSKLLSNANIGTTSKHNDTHKSCRTGYVKRADVKRHHC